MVGRRSPAAAYCPQEVSPIRTAAEGAVAPSAIPLVGSGACHPPGAVVPRTRRRAQRRSPRSGRNEVEEGEALDRSEHAGTLAAKDGAVPRAALQQLPNGHEGIAPNASLRIYKPKNTAL